MAVDGWLVDRSAVARSHLDGVRAELRVLQRNLAHHHGMWHRTATADMLIAETAMHNRLGVVHVDRDFDRIAEVRPLVARRLRVG